LEVAALISADTVVTEMIAMVTGVLSRIDETKRKQVLNEHAKVVLMHKKYR
jgi:hypothetical protein